MSTIEYTVSTVLRDQGLSGYMSQAQPVVQALVEREKDIADQLIDFASDAGLDLEQVRSGMRETGICMREPNRAFEEDTSNEDILTRIDANLRGMAQQVEALTRFARANGFSG